jgi:adenine-specific DNA-methyltransferase
MSIEKLKPSFHFEVERLEQLKQIAPEAFADGKIIWENLQEALGDFVDDENANTEHFGLFWPGKRDARKIASILSEGTLIPVDNEGLNIETTKNIFIEGDNLEVLKLLQKSYANRIKMIYIDPPYNTGHDFIYDDDFTETIDEYLRRTGQLDEEAKQISANTKADGRFHSKWLSMMYPRLLLARNLLNEEGVIFVNIDDNEVSNLKLLMNEVFGEENFIGNFLWKKKSTSTNVEGVQVSALCDYILTYGRTSNSVIKQRVKLKETRVYPHSDNVGNYRSTVIEKKDAGAYKRDTMKFDILGVKPRAGKRWQIGLVKARELEKNNRFYIEDDIVKLKIYDFEDRDTTSANPNLLDNHGTTDSATKMVNNELFNIPELFSNPKPIELINFLIELVLEDGDIVLDFFAGSGTTGHSVYYKNITQSEESKYQFILVQYPEKTKENTEAFKANFFHISEITKARLKLSIAKIKNENKSVKYNDGFKVYKLHKSNYKPWKNYTGTDIKELEMQFENSNSPLVEDWKPENLLSEILLIEGFPLDSKIEEMVSYKYNKITKVSTEFCEHKLLVCLDDNIDDNTINSLELSDNDIFICLDNAISDKDKVTLQDKGLIKTI